MRLKNLLVFVMLAAFAIASATVIVTDNVHGVGRAVNGDGHPGYFQFEVVKVAHNDSVSVKGGFDFYMPGARADNSVRVHVEHVSRMDVADNVATFGGDGVLRIQHGHDVHYFKGSVKVIATSNRHPGEQGPADQIEVHFVPAATTDPTFDFVGTVAEGDIAVTTTKSY